MGDSREAKRVANRLQAQGIALPELERQWSLNPELTRRDILKIAGYGSLAAFLAACGASSSPTSSSITAKGGKMSLGSYNTDPGSNRFSGKSVATSTTTCPRLCCGLTI